MYSLPPLKDPLCHPPFWKGRMSDSPTFVGYTETWHSGPAVPNLIVSNIQAPHVVERGNIAGRLNVFATIPLLAEEWDMLPFNSSTVKGCHSHVICRNSRLLTFQPFLSRLRKIVQIMARQESYHGVPIHCCSWRQKTCDNHSWWFTLFKIDIDKRMLDITHGYMVFHLPDTLGTMAERLCHQFFIH